MRRDTHHGHLLRELRQALLHALEGRRHLRCLLVAFRRHFGVVRFRFGHVGGEVGKCLSELFRCFVVVD